MPKYQVTVDEHTLTVYEVEAEDEEEVETMSFSGDIPVDVNCLNWSITSIIEVT